MSKGNIIVGFVFIEIDIAGIVNHAHDIPDAVGYPKYAVGAYRGIGIPVKGYVVVFLIRLIHVPYGIYRAASWLYPRNFRTGHAL